MIAQLSSQLSMNGFSQFAIGAGANHGSALALLYHPQTADRFEARQGFLAAEVDLRVSLSREPRREADTHRHWQEVEPAGLNHYWGEFRQGLGPPMNLTLGVFTEPTEGEGSDPVLGRYLKGAIDKSWSTCKQHESIRWDVGSSLASMADVVSIGLFRDIETRWASQPGMLQVIFFPFDDLQVFNIVRAALIEVLGADRVHQPPPQLDLFI